MNKSETAKRERELTYFEAFASACPAVPLGRALQPEPPEPDIVIESANGLIGVEMTELVLGGQGRRGVEGEQGMTMEYARRLYESRGYSPVHICVSWASHMMPKHRKRIAERLCELIVQNPPDSGDPREVEQGEAAASPAWPITRIGIARSSGYAASDWRDGDMHKVGACTAADVRLRIAEEDHKVMRYQTAYVSRWLVLVKGAAGPSTWAFVTDDVSKTEYRSLYDRVFLFEMDRRRCHALEVVRPPERC
jgi:hypothetical protein